MRIAASYVALDVRTHDSVYASPFGLVRAPARKTLDATQTRMEVSILAFGHPALMAGKLLAWWEARSLSAKPYLAGVRNSGRRCLYDAGWKARGLRAEPHLTSIRRVGRRNPDTKFH